MPFSRYPSGSCPCQVSLPFELRHFPAGSLSPLSRIEFVSYRLVVLLRLLPTPPHDDAVAVEYGPENVCPVGTFTLLFKCAYERTEFAGFLEEPPPRGECLIGSRLGRTAMARSWREPLISEPDVRFSRILIDQFQRRDLADLRVGSHQIAPARSSRHFSDSCPGGSSDAIRSHFRPPELHFWKPVFSAFLGDPPLSTVPLASSLTLHIHLPGGPSLHRHYPASSLLRRL